MLAADAGRVWARVPRSAAVRSFAPRLRLGVTLGGVGLRRTRGFVRGLRDFSDSADSERPSCDLSTRFRRARHSLAHFGSDRPASRRALGRLMHTNGARLGFRSLFLSRAPLSEEAREERRWTRTCLATERLGDAVASRRPSSRMRWCVSTRNFSDAARPSAQRLWDAGPCDLHA